MSNQAHAGFPSWLVQQALAASAAHAGRGLRVFGICGLQGSGKSTLAAQLVVAARQAGLAAATVSLDDFYLTAARRQALRTMPGIADACVPLDTARTPLAVIAREDR